VDFLQAKHIYILLLVTLVWGVTFPVMKIGVVYTPPLTFGAWRFFLGALCLLPLAIKRQDRFWHEKADLGPLVLLGLLQTAIMGGALLMGVSLVKGSISSVVQYSYPFFYTFFAAVFLREALTWKQVRGLVLGFTGLVVVLEPWRGGLNPPELLGIAIILCGAMSWALASVYLKAAFRNHDKLVVNAYQMLYGSLLLLAVAAAIEKGWPLSWTIPGMGTLLFAALLSSAFAFTALFSIQIRYAASQTSVYLFLVPVFGVLSSALLLGEPLTLNLLVGLLLVALGIVTVNRGGSQEERPVRALQEPEN
jgi:O-acetylserine/cysteine efflux transporter